MAYGRLAYDEALDSYIIKAKQLEETAAQKKTNIAARTRKAPVGAFFYAWHDFPLTI